MDNRSIRIGRTYELRRRRRTMVVRVASRVLVRGEWWNCIDVESDHAVIAHCSEFVRDCDSEPVETVRRPAPRRRRSRWVTAATILAIMPLGYLLSVGPAYGMQRREAISEATFDRIYWPLLSLAHQNESVQSLLARYSQWWV